MHRIHWDWSHDAVPRTLKCSDGRTDKGKRYSAAYPPYGSRVGLLLYHLLYIGIFIARVPRASAIKSQCIVGHTMDNRLHREGYGLETSRPRKNIHVRKNGWQ